jgi:chromosome segregation ATPase
MNADIAAHRLEAQKEVAAARAQYGPKQAATITPGIITAETNYEESRRQAYEFSKKLSEDKRVSMQKDISRLRDQLKEGDNSIKDCQQAISSYERQKTTLWLPSSSSQ